MYLFFVFSRICSFDDVMDCANNHNNNNTAAAGAAALKKKSGVSTRRSKATSRTNAGKLLDNSSSNGGNGSISRDELEQDSEQQVQGLSCRLLSSKLVVCLHATSYYLLAS